MLPPMNMGAMDEDSQKSLGIIQENILKLSVDLSQRLDTAEKKL